MEDHPSIPEQDVPEPSRSERDAHSHLPERDVHAGDIHERDDAAFEGSTIQRVPGAAAFQIGSTASVTPLGAKGEGGIYAIASTQSHPAIDEARTVIRRPDADSGAKTPASPNNTPAAIASVLLGSKLNHFLLEEMIGGGGMGAVFRARDDRLDRVVAIKVIPFVGDDPDLQRRFRNEAQNAARLDHPYIARVFDVGQHEQWHYIVFEYVDGINLRDMVARHGVLAIDDAVYYTRQIAEAIEHADSRGIVHRDIKPSNVLVGTDGNVKVVDMGLARSQQLELSGDMTASGVTLGTFDYISPEQARDPRDADVRSDIYSLGCTLYYLLTASPPYPGGTMLQKLLSHGNAPPPDPRGLRPEVSSDLTAIIHKMLAKDPADRYPRAVDVVSDLRELAFREGLVRAQSSGTLTVTSNTTVPVFVVRHLPWLIACAMVIGIAGWLQISAMVNEDRFQIELPSADYLLKAQSTAELASTANVAALEPATSPAKTGQPSPAPAMATESAAVSSVSEVNAEDVAIEPPRFAEVAIPSTTPAMTPLKTQTLPATATPVQRIVIAEQSDDPAVRAVPTLTDAVELAAELKVNVIEVGSPVITSTPIEIDHDGLIIRSAPGLGNCEIRFVEGETLAMEPIAMIDAGKSRLDLQNLHLHWHVRGTTIDGGALIRVASNNPLVRLANSTITIENLTERDNVFAFEVNKAQNKPVDSVVASSEPAAATAASTTSSASPAGPPDPATAAAASSKPSSSLVIELSNVAARGEMSLIGVTEGVPFQFLWRNGLLAVSRRMMEIEGADVKPLLGNNQVQIIMEQVTAWTQLGLLKMRLGQSRAYPLLIDRKCTRSVFQCNSTANHIEIDGLESDAMDPGQLVLLRGDDNAYSFATTPDAVVLLLGNWNSQERVYRVADTLAAEKLSWITDQSLQYVVRWSKPVSSVTPSRLTIDDFLQDGTLVPGFDRNRLPTFPVRPITDGEI